MSDSLTKGRHTPKWSIGRVVMEDAQTCRTLFRNVFNTEISQSFWNWKYGQGRGCSLLARDRAGDVVAHYGATIRRVRLFGQLVSALQSCDVMVRPQERGLLSRRGVFFQIARHFQELYLGSSGEFSLAYGFPHARAMKLPVLLGLYREIDTVTEIHWRPLESSGWLKPVATAIEGPRDIEAIADRLWPKMAAQLNRFIVVDRSADYLRYRYLNHPEFSYQYWLVRSSWTQRPMGLAILKVESDTVKIMDLLADVSNLGRVILSLRRAMRVQGWKTLIAWAAHNQAPYFSGTDGVPHDMGVCIPDHAWTPGLPMETIKNRWWISLGDTDFA